MEGIFQTMLFFLGLRAMLVQKEKQKGKGMSKGKRGKRANKWGQDIDDDQLTVKRLLTEIKPKKPFEDIKLPPPRDAQKKPD